MIIGEDCLACKKAGTTPSGKMYPTGSRGFDEQVGGSFRNEYYEMKCDRCGEIMHADVAGITLEGRRRFEEYVKNLRNP